MECLWTGCCRLYFNDWAETPLFWSVDDGCIGTEVKCPRVTVAGGSCETVVVPERTVQPRAWLLFTRVSVYRQEDGSILISPKVNL